MIGVVDDEILGELEPFDAEDAQRRREAAKRAQRRSAGPTWESQLEEPFQRGDHVELAQRLLLKIGKGQDLVLDGDSVYRYEAKSGIWGVVESGELSQGVQEFSGHATVCKKGTKPARINAGDVSGAIKLAKARLARPGFFDAAPAGIAFSNGFVIASDGELRLLPLSPDNRSRWAHGFEYVRDPIPEKSLAYLERVHRGEPDKDERIACMLEFAGLCMLGCGTTFNKSLVLFDNMIGGTGKSQWLELQLFLVPPGAASAITPQSMCGDRGEYYRAGLAGKLLNCVNELPEAEVIGAESFKAIVDGNHVQGRHPRGEPFNFRPVAGHIFSTNRLPGSSDISRAFWDRWVCISFNNRIRDTSEDVKEYWRVMLGELGHIASLCLQYGARALSRGFLTIPSSHEAAKAQWRLNADQIALFIDEMLIPLDGDPGKPEPLVWAKSSSVWSAYREWSSAAGYKHPLTRPAFYQRMAMHLGKAIKGRDGAMYWPRRLGEDQHARQRTAFGGFRGYS